MRESTCQTDRALRGSGAWVRQVCEERVHLGEGELGCELGRNGDGTRLRSLTGLPLTNGDSLGVRIPGALWGPFFGRARIHLNDRMEDACNW
jgi:hypothetical protein